MQTAGDLLSAKANEILTIRLPEDQLQKLAAYIVLVIEAKYPPPQTWAAPCPTPPSTPPSSG